MNTITFVYAYFDNSRMLREHMANWYSYPEEVRRNLEVIVTDDVSPNTAAHDVVRKRMTEDQRFKIQVFRIKKKVPWNWLACRNIGAYHAHHHWILLTDMDHMVPVETALYLMETDFDEKKVYLFERQDMPDRIQVKPHDDSYFMTTDRFWYIGGYDERLSGWYGTSGSYRKRVMNKVYGIRYGKGMDNLINATFPRLPVPLVRFGREQILDADTHPSYPKRKEDKWPGGRKSKLDHDYKVLSFPYDRMI